MDIKNRKYFLVTLFITVIFTALIGGVFVWADDNEYEGGYYQSVSPVTVTPPVTAVATQQTPAASVKTITTTLQDSDGDGILDKDDPHPTIPEIYIVTDNNHNGIVDKFEK